MIGKVIKIKGFTLVELMVVIAISVVLIGLLLIPIIKTLEVNRMTTAYTNAQQNSRQAMSLIRKDISEAMYVEDSEITPMLLPVNGLVDSNGNKVNKPIKMQYAVLNLMLPKTEFYCSNPNHNTNFPRNFARGDNYESNGKELAMNKCPYCDTDEYVKVIPKIPVEKGTTVVRYFLGLRNNGTKENPVMICENPLDINSWTTAEGMGWLPNDGNTKVEGDENQLYLYRVEFDPIRDNGLFPEEYSLNGLSTSSEEYQIRLHRRITDPNVFYCPECAENWAAIIQNVGVLEGLDLGIAKDKDYIDGMPMNVNNIISFTPAAISGEAPIANASTTYSQDDQGAPPSSFKTKYALLGNSLQVDCVRVNPTNQKPIDKWTLKHLSNSLSRYANVYHVSDLESINPVLTNSDLVFNVSDYIQKGEIDNLEQEMAYTYDQEKGEINFSMIPVSWYNDDLNIDQSKLLYYPELEVYAYKFNPYKNATIVPGSENVEYYNAYWLDYHSQSFIDLGYDYNDLYDNDVDQVRYQRAAFSLGQLNYNQYKIDYEEGIIYWKPVLNHSKEFNIYPTKYRDIPKIIDYRIQFNRNNDKITLSYMTNQVIDVNITMSMVYDAYKTPRSSIINERVVVGNSLK